MSDMDAWDWGDIHVITGEYWLALIALTIAAIAFGIGYLLGEKQGRRRERELWTYPNPAGGATRLEGDNP